MARHNRNHRRLPNRLLGRVVHNPVCMLWDVMLLFLLLIPQMLRLLWWML
jgi:hypothetical protein